MKILYIDCNMGAAGDMLTAALLELLPNQSAFIDEMNHLGIPGMHMQLERAHKCGITGSHVSVEIYGEEEHSHDVHLQEHHTHAADGHPHTHGHDHAHSHAHSSLHDIGQIVDHLTIPQKVKEDVMAVYQLIAEAESAVHGVPVSDIHFHEVGSLDAVTDIVAVSLLLHKLNPDSIVVSPIHVGTGHVHCAHGILPVPAPATAHILRSVPMYGGEIEGELCTPTGAALLKYFASSFGPLPAMCADAVGYGMGTKEFPAANCVRTMLGQSADRGDRIAELACNVDDMTGEEIAFACGQLLKQGALDVYTAPVMMKKGRPGTMITVICPEADQELTAARIFRYTSTLGIRVYHSERYTLSRRIHSRDTAYGPIRRKDASGYGVSRFKYEYEDLAAAAEKNDCSLAEIMKSVQAEQPEQGSIAELMTEMRDRWDTHAGHYDSSHSHGINDPAEMTLWTELFRNKAGAPLLDVGCGTGFVSLLAAQSNLNVTAIDWSSGMMDLARKKAADQELAIRFVQCQTESLPFQDGTFQYLTARHVIWTLTQPLTAFREWYRVLQTGGTVFADYSPREEVPATAQHYRVEIEQQLPLNRKISPQELTDLFRKAGFSHVHVKELHNAHHPRYLFTCTK